MVNLMWGPIYFENRWTGFGYRHVSWTYRPLITNYNSGVVALVELPTESGQLASAIEDWRSYAEYGENQRTVNQVSELRPPSSLGWVGGKWCENSDEYASLYLRGPQPATG